MPGGSRCAFATAAAPRGCACARCRAPVARPEDAISHGGAHHHTFSNPHGYVFELRCFSEAAGCGLVGPATREHSWFPGLAWRLGGCLHCGLHLGWGFVKDDGQVELIGLIADCITEEP